MTYKNFSIAVLRPEDYILLGEGVWGRVYDLGDGTILKIARDACAGIGSGREKIGREYAALQALAGAPGLQGILPQALGTGEIPPDSPLAEDGFSLWLRMTKHKGKQFYVQDIADMPAQEQETTGRSAGKALALLHKAMAGISPPDQAGHGGPYEDIKNAVEGDAFYTACIEILEKERTAIPAAIMNRPAHNDYNISNLLFAGHEVCGILDFAEWGVNFPEKDISDIVNDCPWLAPSMIHAYEKESGFKTDPRRLALGVAENGLYGAVIGLRRGDEESIRWGRGLLVSKLEELGHETLREKTAPAPRAGHNG